MSKSSQTSNNPPIVICLHPGQSIRIEFRDELDDACDGDLVVAYDEDAIRVRTDWPDDKLRGGSIEGHPDGDVIYEASFGTPDQKDSEEIFHSD